VKQSYNNSVNGSEEVIGASGGLPKYNAYRAKSDFSNSEHYEKSFPFSYEQKFSGSSNFTDKNSSTATNTKNVHHNHTYPLPTGRKSREELEEDARREKEDRATRLRDEKRAKAMKVGIILIYDTRYIWHRCIAEGAVVIVDFVSILYLVNNLIK